MTYQIIFVPLKRQVAVSVVPRAYWSTYISYASIVFVVTSHHRADNSIYNRRGRQVHFATGSLKFRTPWLRRAAPAKETWRTTGGGCRFKGPNELTPRQEFGLGIIFFRGATVEMKCTDYKGRADPHFYVCAHTASSVSAD